ncbi:MAG: S8 family serine peptidase [Planctomycetes bacterium]|nr:S8 family serine peptidase [Planctomycetota bacterium]
MSFVLPRSIHRWTAATLVLLPAAAQQASQLSAPAPTSVASSRSTPHAGSRPASALETADGGRDAVSAAQLESDAIPLPHPAVYAPGAEGDVLVTPASGDPFVLSFAAGSYAPPTSERIDPLLLQGASSQPLDGRPAVETFAFAMFSKRITPERIQALEDLGCRVLEFHPHYALKLALPVEAIDGVGALDFVRWIGVPRTWQKVQPRLASEVASWPAGRAIDVWVDVFESDANAASRSEPFGSVELAQAGEQVPGPESARSLRCMSNGWQQHALQAAGVEVLEYVDRLKAFRARILPQALEGLVGLDFVQFVEVALPATPAHDESMPLALLDATRATHDGNDASVAAVGQVDSGIDIGHNALNHLYTVGWDSTGEGSAILDNCGHGSHVAGTIAGLPNAAQAALEGAASGVGANATQRLFNVKKFSSAACTSSAASLSSLFAHFRSDFTDGSGFVSPRPHVINNSYGLAATIGNPWIGSEADARTIDAEVWDHGQFYVFSAGNEGGTIGDESIRLEGSAKNAFTVGSVRDWYSGTIQVGDTDQSSSRGPCADGRFKPNVVAPGGYITSAQSNTANGFTNRTSTSHAAAHVTGLAAQLCDHYAFLKYAPERLASLVMGTSMPYADQRLTTQASDTASIDHLNEYGAGRINAAAAHWSWLDSHEHANYFGELTAAQSSHRDFVVDPGCVRLVLVFTYHEDQCSAGAAQALVNDFDMWIDSPLNGIDPANNTGEYSAHQSAVDNTEIRTIDTPQTGTWRYKIWPDSATSSIRYSVTVVQIFGDSTPNGTLTLSASDTFVQPQDDVVITATADSPTYFGEALFFDSTSSGDTLQAATMTLEDGVVADMLGNTSSGRDIAVGTILPDQSRAAQWTTRWATEGVKTWSVEARSDTWVDETQQVQITVDGTQPSLPTGVHSTTHTPNVWSNVTTIQFAWTPSVDNLSGLAGYSARVQTAATLPIPTQNLGPISTTAAAVTSGSWYLNLRPVDNCGNWHSAWAFTGPFKIDATAPSGPTSLVSSTHTAGVLSCAPTVSVNWSAASDALSGLAGYVGIVDTNPTTDPTGTLNIAAGATSYSANLGFSPNARYLHLRAQDNAGNWSTTAHFGPLLIQASQVSTYCTGKTNSLGCVPAMGWTGSTSKSANNFTVVCSSAISQKNGIVFWGQGQIAGPFQGGTLCVQAPTVRTPIQSSGGSAAGNDCSGSYAFTFDTAYMNAWGIDPGDTLYAQCWMRDPAASFTTGLSNAVRFTVCE